LTHKNIEIEGVEVFSDIQDCLKALSQEGKIYIIGGASIYTQFLPLADEIELTQIKKTYDGDAFFPQFEDDFIEIKREKHKDFDFVTYKQAV